jgi:hypothetical protein
MKGSRLGYPANKATAALMLVALAAAGCAQRLPTGDVSGRVTYNGKNLPSGSVAIYGGNNQVESSLVAPDGKYHIPYAPCGEVRITVQTPPVATGRGARMSIPSIAIPKRYSDSLNSPLKYTVSPGEQTYDIELTGPASIPTVGAKGIDPEAEVKVKMKSK